MGLPEARTWILNQLSEIPDVGHGLDGAVVTGELASVLIEGSRFAERLLKGSIVENLLIAGDSAPSDLLSIGAREQCRKMTVESLPT